MNKLKNLEEIRKIKKIIWTNLLLNPILGGILGYFVFSEANKVEGFLFSITPYVFLFAILLNTLGVHIYYRRKLKDIGGEIITEKWKERLKIFFWFFFIIIGALGWANIR